MNKHATFRLPFSSCYSTIIFLEIFLCKLFAKIYWDKETFFIKSNLFSYYSLHLSIFFLPVRRRWSNPVYTDIFKTSSGRLKKITTSYDQTRRPQYVWKKTSELRRLQEVLFLSSWRRLIYDVLKTSDLWRLEDVWFKTSWRRPTYVVLQTSNLWRLEDVCKTTSV